ncbi:hypothetical protein GCM10027072_79950 [Streptomyces bullii]
MATAISEVSSLTGRRTSMPVPPANLSPPQFARLDDLASAAIRGLSGHPKQIPARWLYDGDGSALFEEIAKAPEYYITGAEQSLLAGARAFIADVTGARTLIELGSGAPERTRLLLDALRGTLTAYMPFDVSSSAVSRTSEALAAEYPAVAVTPLVADFTESLDHPPADGDRA